MALVYRDPFLQLQRELEQMLGQAFGPTSSLVAGVYPPVDVFDAGDVFVVKAELPGLKREDIQVEVEDATLTLRGERRLGEPGREAAYHRRERQEGSFRRTVRLPARLAADEASAEYRDGVLTVRIPKAKETRPRRLEIQAA